MAGLLNALVLLTSLQATPPASRSQYTIEALRYATVPAFPLASLLVDAAPDARIDIAMVVWLIRSGDHTILFDTGFHRRQWFDRFTISDYMRPDSVVRLAGVDPAQVTDVIVSHAHWDHMGGIDLFPNATIWIQRDEYTYYVRDAWQAGGRNGGIDREDIAELVRRNTAGTVRLIDGDDVEILPGIRAYTGARHTWASQYIRVDAGEPWVLASDNAYLYRNIEDGVAGATFDRADRNANLAALARMVGLAGARERVVPGHDAAQFERVGATGRIAKIR
jgi:glyoxylase-like metal-dependent hydrolase (beta-lactamase superfamily II)